jgi:20S proteasome subunit alpha 2
VLKQVQNALAAVKKGQAALGICATNGVVIACEKNLPTTLIDLSSCQKCIRIADHIGFVYAGMNPDSRVLASMAQKKALAYFGLYHERIPVLQLVRAVAETMQKYTQSGGVRPFGVSLLIAGTDDDGPQLYQVDPSGAYFGWKAGAIGKNFIESKTFLAKRYREDIELEDAINTAILTLKEGFDGQMTNTNIELAIVTPEGGFRALDASEVQDYLTTAE